MAFGGGGVNGESQKTLGLKWNGAMARRLIFLTVPTAYRRLLIQVICLSI
jgi:hypothetical protein